jgi:fatty acid synthase
LTKSFDNNANGCTRSEAVSVLFIQRASDARRIYQEIVNIKSLHVHSVDDKSIFYPTVEAQIKVMTEVLNESKLSPNDILFVEANGVGIKKVDADELEAIDAVYGKRKQPLLIGSVKSNIGNTIPVNSITSIIKVML